MLSKWCRCCVSAPGKVPLWKKLAYAVGCIPYSMCSTVIGIYFNIFLLEIVILDPIYVMVISVAGYIWDAVTDPVIGYLTLLTNTRFGRLRPWMGLAMVPTAVTYFLMWVVPPILQDVPQGIKFIYYLILYLAYRLASTCIYMPFNALLMHISDNNKERDSVAFYRVCSEQSGFVIGTLIFSVFFFIFSPSSQNRDCNSEGMRVPDPQLKAAYLWHALTVAVLIVICTSVSFISVRERKEETEKKKKGAVVRSLVETLCFRPFVYFMLMNGFNYLSAQFFQSNGALFYKYSVGLKNKYPIVIQLILVSAVLWTIPWKFFTSRFGKKTAYFVGMWSSMPVILVGLYTNYFPTAAYFFGCLLGSNIACGTLIAWLMLPDVIDEATLAQDVRREELFYAFFVFVVKTASGLGAGLSALSYEIAGYDENSCKQPWTVSLTIKIMITVIPILSILLSLLFLHFYPITEKTREKTERLLAERRAQDASKNGTVGDNELVNGISNSSVIDPTSPDKTDTTESSKLTNSNGHFPSN